MGVDSAAGLEGAIEILRTTIPFFFANNEFAPTLLQPKTARNPDAQKPTPLFPERLANSTKINIICAAFSSSKEAVLACLQSKNAGAFGQCQRGVFVEQHGFDQECDRCVEEDEGLGDVGQEIRSEPVKRKSDEEAEDQRKKQRV
ncbi:hypothetical protein E4U09_006035 [Claviceps aff. purpurea]|uniref:Uncharacterized protein n=1 Tax=Claviceps aff. purpurea TaxID=1967640 RepID=A0A9P7U5H8_9HYPO|nr:hypothetical protein E4U09_006035 [Claviceps aff. purpurea]